MQTEGDPELVQRCIIEGPLDVHPSQSAVVVHYDVEAMVVSEYGEPMVADRKRCSRIIKVKNLTESTDVHSLARQIVTKCDLIAPNRVPELEQILSYLQGRKDNKGGRDVLEDSSQKIRKQMEDLQQSTEQATMANLDTYLESLYDDLQAKINGTALILQLARTPDNLFELAGNESFFLALARVLRDDWKKSIDLATNIVYIFFCFSTFSIFHGILSKQKIGSMCMTILEYELKRHKTLLDDLSSKKRSKASKADVSLSSSKKEYEKGKKKYQQVLKKQETLLRVALYLLLNLAEDTRVEFKMRNKGLPLQLCSLLERDNQELLILVVSFLKKLSIFAENKEDMAKGNIVKRLTKLIPCDNEILVNVTLRLVLNLSFDPTLRQEMVKVGILPKLVVLLKSESHRTLVLCILYHISIEDKSRPVFAYTDCVPQIMQMIVECQEELVEPETIALGINLACSPRNAQFMVKGPGLKLLMRRAAKTHDSLLLKMIRNISQHQGPIKKLFLPYLSELGQLLKDSGDDEVCVEVLGILGNLCLPEVDFERVISQLELMPFILAKLKDPVIKDDMLLEVINMCGTFSLDEKCAQLLLQVGLPDVFVSILKAKQEDDELVLQIVYVFHQLVLHESTREKTIGDSQIPDYLMELMNDKNKEISKLCSRSLDIIAAFDPDRATKIKHERFRWHNFQWLEMMTGESLYEDNEEEFDEDYLDPHYLHTAAELYDHPDLYYEMQGQLESTHGDSTGYQVELGRNLDVEDELNFSETMGAHGIYPYQEPGFEEVADDREAFSQHQYTMLMNSMQEPLSMYSTMSPSARMDGRESRRDRVETELYAGRGLLSPRFEEDAVHVNVIEDYSDHPAFTGIGAHEQQSSFGIVSPSRPPRYGF